MTSATLKPYVLLIMLFAGFYGADAQEVHSLGVFTGFTIPYTWDEGFNKDPRYRVKYNVKFAPIGIHYGVDRPGFGFTFDPSIFKAGQHFNVINIAGGDVGERNINLTYFHAPIGFKLHLIDMSFFKVSFVASASVAYLIGGEETISHTDSKLRFSPAVIPNLPPGYIEEYDVLCRIGILVKTTVFRLTCVDTMEYLIPVNRIISMKSIITQPFTTYPGSAGKCLHTLP